MTKTSCTVFVVEPGKVERVAGRLELPYEVSWDDACVAATERFGDRVCHICFTDDDGALARSDPDGEQAIDLTVRSE